MQSDERCRGGGVPAAPAGTVWTRTDPRSKVLIVTNMWPEAERPVYGIFVQRQVEALERLSVYCDVLYVRGYRDRRAYGRCALWCLTNTRKLAKRYELVHAHAGETGLAARFSVSSRMLTSYCGDDLLGDPSADGSIGWFSRVRALVIRLHSVSMAATITKSEEMAAALPVRSKNDVIPNGVDERLFAPRGKSDARSDLGWEPDSMVALFAATKPDAPRKRLWLAKEACEAASRRLGATVQLHVAKGVDPATMPTLMNAADLLLLTSSVEGSPNVVKEAMMCNLPVVTTHVGDVREMLRGVTPATVAEATADALADGIVSSVGRRADSRGLAIERFADLAIAARVKDLYEGLSEAT